MRSNKRGPRRSRNSAQADSCADDDNDADPGPLDQRPAVGTAKPQWTESSTADRRAGVLVESRRRRGWESWYPASVAFDTHAAVKTLTDAGADEALAVAVIEVAREASTEATGDLVTRSHFDAALAQLESRLAWRLVTAGIAIAAVVVAALRFLG